MISTRKQAPSYVGSSMRIEGILRSVNPIWIDGEVLGEIHCETEIMIGETAQIRATIYAEHIRVNGHIEGELFAGKKVEVLPEGRVRGKVSNPPGGLKVHQGGVINGQCITVFSTRQTPEALAEQNSTSSTSSSTVLLTE